MYTTTFSLTGEYAADIDEHTIRITHGYSKDHRPDLKQIVHELLVTQDGGVPLMMKSWDGNASDNQIFKERCKQLISHFSESENHRYLVADSKLYTEKNAGNLQKIPYITRIPGTVKGEPQIIDRALHKAQWAPLDASNRYYEEYVVHYGIKQRWIVVYSEKAKERAEKNVVRASEKEKDKLEKAIRRLSHQPYNCKSDAQKALDNIVKGSYYHKAQILSFTEKKVFSKTGRPQKNSDPSSYQYFIAAVITLDEDACKKRVNEKSCYVISSNINEKELSTPDVINAYKGQNTSIENIGFRFLKDPIFFVSSLYIKKPSRIMGLLTVMTLALLVYSIAQRRLRQSLKQHNETLPNQINQPKSRPTLRWIFQMMNGINFVKIDINNTVSHVVEGVNDLKKKIICCFGTTVMKIYDIQENIFSEMGGYLNVS